jgi:hypothetical protein
MAVTVANKGGGKPSWLLTGTDTKKAVEQWETKIKENQEAAGRPRRFFLTEDLRPETTITFLDGDLNGDGLFEPQVWEHGGIFHDGDYKEFLCTARVDKSQPCPICAAGDQPYLGAFFTIIDHGAYVLGKKSKNAGASLYNRKLIFVAKPKTAQLLMKHAAKKGGLAGCSFEVTRSSKQDPRVGSIFDFVTKHEDVDAVVEFAKKHGPIPPEAQEDLDAWIEPFSYGDLLDYKSPDELIEMGLGQVQATIGQTYAAKNAGGGGFGTKKTFSKAALENEL